MTQVTEANLAPSLDPCPPEMRLISIHLKWLQRPEMLPLLLFRRMFFSDESFSQRRPTCGSARSSDEHSPAQSRRDKSTIMYEHVADSFFLLNDEAGCLLCWQAKAQGGEKKVLAGDETPPPPRLQFSPLQLSRSARFVLTAGAADATFAQAGKRARPVINS